MTLRYVAPAGAPIGARHLARWAAAMTGGGDTCASLRRGGRRDGSGSATPGPRAPGAPA